MNPTSLPEQQSPVPSPCINVCKMAADRILCGGCLRTIAEIKAWRDADDAARRVIWAAIRVRAAERDKKDI